MKVEYHPLTISELNAAIAFLNRQRAGLGNELRSEVYAAIERIRDSPKQYPVIAHDVRRCFVHRFPYSILFRVVGDNLLRVLVVRHHRRDPGLGLGRR